MGELPTPVVGEAYQNSVAWETLEALVDVAPRMAGHDGERAGAEILAETFERVGLRDVTRKEFDIPGWWRGTASVELPALASTYDQSHQVIGLPGTPEGAVPAELVDVGYGTPAEYENADIEGKLVLARGGSPEDYDRWLHRREKYDAAVDGGAAGFIYRGRVDGSLPPTGDIGDEDGEAPIPAVGVSAELGARLSRHADDETVEARLAVDCRSASATSVNVSGTVGPDTDERILLTAHHDAHDIAEGAKDNGVGCALVAEVGRLLGQVEDELETAVQCTTFGAEEVGLHGSKMLADSTELDSIAAVVNLDAIGNSRDLTVATHGFEELGDAFETVSETLDTPVEVTDDVEPHSDHWPFVQRGVPGVMAHTMGGSGARGWGHTHADTLDKLDRRDLRDLAVPLAAGVLELADADRSIEAVDPETVEQRAREQGYPVD